MQRQPAVQKKTSDEVEKKGDFCIVNMSTTKDERATRTVITKCPYDGMYIATTSLHKIKEPGMIMNFFAKLGLPVGVTVVPHMECPYNTNHKFSIKRGWLILMK